MLAKAALGEGLIDGCPRAQAQRVRVCCDDPVDVHLDGESVGHAPVQLRIRPAALPLIDFEST